MLAAFENYDVKMTSSGDIITMHQNQKALLAPLGKLSDVTTALIHVHRKCNVASIINFTVISY